MRKVGYRIIAALLGVACALVFAEVAVRLLLPPPERARLVADSGHAERLAAENAEQKLLRVDRSVDDPSAGGVLYFHTPTGMRFRANTRAVIQNHGLGGGTIEVRTNSLGYRNRELGVKDRPRVLFVGDSITSQDYLQEEQTIVRLVETLSESTDRPIETVNSGVGAIGIGNELAILMETGFSAEPDTVVLNWYLNDAQASAGIEIVELSGWWQHSRLAEQLLASLSALDVQDLSVFSYEADAAWKKQAAEAFPPAQGDWRREPGAFNQRIQALFFDWGSAWSEGAWARMAPVIAEMKRQCDLHGVRFRIVAFPVLEQINAEFVHDYPQQRLAEIARELDVPMLDLLPLLREKSRQVNAPQLHWDWCHPSPEGSVVIAGAILDFLQREGGST
ncbi:MAG: hypothetical protein P8R42_10725 [Candidatus Binatia bacterium]|nr:hypothetical protein [Candidatus Binatia bacterium]